MARIRKQHYVPRFYLRNFGNPIFCFDKQELRIFSPTPERIAFETDFYGIAVDGGESVEKVLSSMDYKFSVGYNELLAKGDLKKLGFENLANFFAFIATQYLRTRSHRDFVIANTQFLFDEIVKQMGIDDYRIELTNEGKVGMHLSSMTNFGLYSAIVGQMKFIFLRNTTSIPFWTSDNPIFPINEFDQSPFGNLGIMCRGIELHFPLTPTLGLIVCDPSLYGNEKDFVDVTEQNVNYENILQIYSSSRHLFSNVNNFDFAKNAISNTVAPGDVIKCISVPKYARKNNSRIDYWPNPDLSKQIFEIMKKEK